LPSSRGDVDIGSGLICGIHNLEKVNNRRDGMKKEREREGGREMEREEREIT
jgi:hypothetical protein